MRNGDANAGPVLSHAEPVMAVRDVEETIQYWQKVLGFPNKWTWGDPPDHGGVSWQKVFVQFHKDEERAAASKGNIVWIRVQRIALLYAIHQQKNADIIEPLKAASYGFSRYIIRDINGYMIHFAGPYEERETGPAKLPENIQIVARVPTEEEARALSSSIGWRYSSPSGNGNPAPLPVVFAVVAENSDDGTVVASALLLGDQRSFYYIKDVMVHPDWQGRRIGTALMIKINNWLDRNATNHSLVGLFAKETLEPFYQQFGFSQAFAMLRYIEREE
ncbi:GNAT family N-acetyltransferase [Danxiaibacter flavus]|uniref:GNAT family N-acetyltransferase n=1 Tax=Danxiaibacter flavus TaxID=3049108 RepID=A0ABV3ZH93_9BACT|nr:GNAT family N-acetyltransferase [Chitinophagaceae bacterium DXS]